jgi:hypothetical protein
MYRPTWKKIAFISFIIFLSLQFNHYCWGWWFQKSNEKLLQEALKSDNPKKVEKCLDTFIQKNKYACILQIKRHANVMLRLERNKLLKAGSLNSKNTKKHLAPWGRIEKKATFFFKRKAANKKGNELNRQ